MIFCLLQIEKWKSDRIKNEKKSLINFATKGFQFFAAFQIRLVQVQSFLLSLSQSFFAQF